MIERNSFPLSWLAILLMALAPISSLASAPRAQISQGQVLAALEGARLPVQSSQVQWFSAVTTKTPEAVLQVAGIEPWSDADALVKLRCAKSSDCLPFYLGLRWQTPAQRDSALANSILKSRPHSILKAEPMVRAGQQATLITTDSRFHARTPIICLQSGTQGQKVRIATMDHKKIAMAEVIDSGVLRGSF